MFKKVKCDKCENRYDEAFNECPVCHAPNTKLDPSLKKIQILSILKQVALFAVGLGGLQLIAVIASAIISKSSLMDKDYELISMVLNTVVYSITFLILALIVNVDWKKLFKSFKSWKPFVAGLVCFFSMIAFSMFYNIFLNIIGVSFGNNDNQQSIDATAVGFPFTSMIIFGIIGPICEELTYRVGLFSFGKRISKWVAYPVTIVVFALIHFSFSSPDLTNEIINLPFYLFGAFALCFVYDKFGFAGSVTAHVLNNVISLMPATVIFGIFR